MKIIYKYLIIIFLCFSYSYSNVNFLCGTNFHTQNIFRETDITKNSPIIKPELSIMFSDHNIWFNTIFSKSLSKNNFQQFQMMFGYTKIFNEIYQFELRTNYSTYPTMTYNSAFDIYLKYSYENTIPIAIDLNYNIENNGLYSTLKSSFFFDFYLPWIIETSIGYNINSYNQYNYQFSRGFSNISTTLLTYLELNRINIEPSITIVFPFKDKSPEIIFSIYCDYVF